MNGIRWTTGIGIAVGGAFGALAALLGSPPAPPVVSATAAPIAGPADSVARAAPVVGSAAAETPATSPSAPDESKSIAPAVAAPKASATTAIATPASLSPPALELPTTQAGLLKAEMLCDQKKDFDECARAAEALEMGSTGAADPEQGKRFRRIALTHLVSQCESGSPHGCFVLAAKYRAGRELTASPGSADTLEKRGLELCKKRSAPECPAP